MRKWTILIASIVIGISGCREKESPEVKRFDVTIVFTGEGVNAPEIQADELALASSLETPIGQLCMTVVDDTTATFTFPGVKVGDDYPLQIVYYIPAAGAQRRAVSCDSLGNLIISGRTTANGTLLTRTATGNFLLTLDKEGNCY